MDNRLALHKGRRISALRKEDLPGLAHALVAAIRGRAVVGRLGRNATPYVAFDGPGVRVDVLQSDWAKIQPYIQNGFLNPLETPVGPNVGYLDPRVAFDEPIQDHADRALYDRVFGLLNRLVTEAYPTRPY